MARRVQACRRGPADPHCHGALSCERDACQGHMVKLFERTGGVESHQGQHEGPPANQVMTEEVAQTLWRRILRSPHIPHRARHPTAGRWDRGNDLPRDRVPCVQGHAGVGQAAQPPTRHSTTLLWRARLSSVSSMITRRRCTCTWTRRRRTGASCGGRSSRRSPPPRHLLRRILRWPQWPPPQGAPFVPRLVRRERLHRVGHDARRLRHGGASSRRRKASSTRTWAASPARARWSSSTTPPSTTATPSSAA